MSTSMRASRRPSKQAQSPAANPDASLTGPPPSSLSINHGSPSRMPSASPGALTLPDGASSLTSRTPGVGILPPPVSAAVAKRREADRASGVPPGAAHVATYCAPTGKRLQSLHCTTMTLEQLLSKLSAVKADPRFPGFTEQVGERARHAVNVAAQLNPPMRPSEFPPLVFPPGGVLDAVEELVESLESTLARSKRESAKGQEVPVCELFIRGECKRGVTCSFAHVRESVAAWVARWLRRAAHPVTQRTHLSQSGAGAFSRAAPAEATLTTAQSPLGQEAWAVIVDILRSPARIEKHPPVTRIVARQVGAAAMRVLCPAVQHAWIPGLTHLDLSKNTLPGRSVVKLAAAIPTSRLRELNLAGCDLGLGGALLVLRAVTATVEEEVPASPPPAFGSMPGGGSSSGPPLSGDEELPGGGSTVGPDGRGSMGLEPSTTMPGLASPGQASAAPAAKVMTTIQRSSELTALNLASNGINAADPAFAHFCIAFVDSATQLEKLSLADNALGADGVRKLLRGVNDRFVIRTARQYRAAAREAALRAAAGGGHAAASALAQQASGAAVPPVPTLRFLSLAANRIGDAGVAAVAETLQNTTLGRQLLHLDLSWNRAGCDGLSALCSAIAQAAIAPGSGSANGSPSGAVGTSSGPQPSPGGLPDGAALPRSRSPPDHHGGGGRRDSNSVPPSPSALSGPNASSQEAPPTLQLQSLDLHYNLGIGRRGANVLAQLLKSNATLTSIDLRWTSLGEEGVASFNEPLSTNMAVLDLPLTGNDVDPRIVDGIASRLRRRLERGLPPGVVTPGACVW